MPQSQMALVHVRFHFPKVHFLSGPNQWPSVLVFRVLIESRRFPRAVFRDVVSPRPLYPIGSPSPEILVLEIPVLPLIPLSSSAVRHLTAAYNALGLPLLRLAVSSLPP